MAEMNQHIYLGLYNKRANAITQILLMPNSVSCSVLSMRFHSLNSLVGEGGEAI